MSPIEQQIEGIVDEILEDYRHQRSRGSQLRILSLHRQKIRSAYRLSFDDL